MKKQEGIVLVIALIMLIAVTLIAVTGANISLAQLKVVQNFEAKQHMRMVAENAIEEAIVTPGFLQGVKAFNRSCYEDPYTKCVDLSGDGVPDSARVTLSKPECISIQPVLNNQLNVWESEADAACYQAGTRENGFTQTSLCADTLWEVRSVAYDPVTNAKVYYKHGLTLRTSTNLVAAACGAFLDDVLTNG